MNAEERAAAVLGLVEGTNAVADTLDSLKQALEGRGWSASAAEQASIAIMGQLVLAAAMSGGRR